MLAVRSDTSFTQGLKGLDAATWLRAIPYSVVAAVVIAIPADLIDNRFFGRPIPPRTLDYVILAVTAGLIGLVLAIRAPLTEKQERRTLGSGLVSFLAVGCPVCNQAVVALVGTSGALSWWAPVQPVVGLVAVALLLWMLRQILATYQLVACPI